MRFTKKTPSRKNKDIEVFNFSLSLTELLLIHSLIKKTLDIIPNHFEIRPSVSRLMEMSRTISKVLNAENIDVQELKQATRNAINETNEKLLKGGYRKNL